MTQYLRHSRDIVCKPKKSMYNAMVEWDNKKAHTSRGSAVKAESTGPEWYGGPSNSLPQPRQPAEPDRGEAKRSLLLGGAGDFQVPSSVSLFPAI